MNKMKKWGGCLAMVLALTMVLACSLVFTACSHTPGMGDTYVFEDCQVSFSADVSEETKAMFNENLASMKEQYKGSEITFVDNDKCTMKMGSQVLGSSMYYKVDGDKVIIADSKANLSDSEKAQKATIDGETLVVEQSNDGVTTKIIYKLSK